MANTYTYYQSPNHGGPLPASGKVVLDGSTEAVVQCGFIPSMILLLGDYSTDACHIWFNGMGTDNSAIITGAAAVGAAKVTVYAGSATEKPGFKIAGNTGTGSTWWIAFP